MMAKKNSKDPGISLIDIKELKPNKNNPRFIKDTKFKQILTSIANFPQMLELRPLVVDENNEILGGNMRYRALLELGITQAHIIRVTNFTEEQKKEFIIKDNLNYGEWDYDLLANEWNSDDLCDWGMDVWNDSIEQEPEQEQENEQEFKFTLNYSQSDYQQIKEALKKYSEPIEEVFYNLICKST